MNEIHNTEINYISNTIVILIIDEAYEIWKSVREKKTLCINDGFNINLYDKLLRPDDTESYFSCTVRTVYIYLSTFNIFFLNAYTYKFVLDITEISH